MIPLVVVITILTGLVTIIGSWLGGGRVWGYWPAHIWARMFCWLSFVRVTVTGRENIDRKTSYVFVANHQGAYDIFAIYGYLNHNFKWMMKKGSAPFSPVIRGKLCRRRPHICRQFLAPGHTPHHGQGRGHVAPRHVGGRVPEGSRSRTGRLGVFHKGAYQLAMEFALPVVPVTIDGAIDVLLRGHVLPHWGHIKLTIHKPIAPPTDEADRRRVIDESRAAVASALPPQLRG